MLRGFLGMGVPGILFAILSAISMLCFITSFRHTTVAHVAISYAAVPFVAGGMACIAMREKPGASAMIASAAALLGVGMMVGLGREGGLLGDFLALGMMVTMAATMVIARCFRGIPVMPAVCLSALLSALAVAPFGDPLSVSLTQFGQLALFGLVNSALSLALFTLGARLLPAIETALIGSLDSPLALVWVWIAFGEVPSAATLIGGAIVFAALLAHIVREARTSSGRR